MRPAYDMGTLNPSDSKYVFIFSIALLHRKIQPVEVKKKQLETAIFICF